MLSAFDENILEKYVGEEEITADDLRSAIRSGTIANEIVPILNGTAFKNKGVQPLLDAIVDFLPSPLDLPPTKGMNLKGDEELERQASDKEPFSALAFKIMTDPHVGKLVYFRVYSGTLEKGGTVVNTTNANKERIGRILQMHANSREDIDAVFTGDIAAGIGFKNTRTGDSLSAPGARDRAGEPRVPRAGDPRGRRAQDQGRPGQDGQGPLRPVGGRPHLPGAHRRGDRPDGHLRHGRAPPRGDRRPHAARVHAWTPPSASRRWPTARRSPSRSIKHTYTHKKQTGGKGQFAEVTIDLEPTGPGGGYEFVDKITGGRVPKEYIPSVDAGIQQSLDAGVLAGYPTVDVRAVLTDGKYHDVDSSEMAFKIAGSMAFKEALRRAKPVLLEPIMSVEVVTPEEYMGDVIGDLNSRRGQVGGMDQRGNSQVVQAHVPLSEMFGYSTDLRSRTQGRATYTMQFDSYQQTPASVQEEIVTRVRGE